MPQCAVTTCKNNHRKTKGRRVRYHRFPAEDDVRSRWVSVCGRGTFNTATARVCSLHFSPHSYERDVEHEMLGLPPRSRLKRGAVPDRAVPITLPSLIGRWKNVRPRQQQVGRAAPRKGRKPASKTPPQLPLDDEDKDDVITGTGIDVLLALGLTPIERRDQDGVHDGLNRMHVMEEDAALDDLPKTNGSPMQCQTNSMPPPGGGGQENGTKIEDIKDSKEEEHVPINKEDDDTDKAVPVDAKLHLAEEETKVHESVMEPKNQKETVLKQAEQSEPATKAILGEEACSLPPSPPEEEEEEVSAASSPESQEAKVRGRPVSSRKRESSESDSDGNVAKHLKLGMPSSPRREAEERERSVSEYVENAAGTSLEELRKSTDKLQKEIHALDALARAKEHEWNGIIRLKKVKEEVYLRLQRKRQVMLLMMGKTPSDTMDWDFSSDLRYGEYMDADKVKTSECTTTTTVNNIKTSVPGRISSKESVVPQQQAMAAGMSVLKNNNQNNQIPVMMVPIVSSTPTSLPSHLSSSMGIREKTAPRIPHRPILPKPTTAVLLGANGTGPGASNNGQNPVIGEGRQGPILDVRSIIADYRSRHPETVPRRGRRLKSSVSPTPAENLVTSTRVVSGAGGGGILSMSSLALGSGSQMRTGVVGTSSDMGELSFLLSEAAASGTIKQDSSRPSSADSSRSGALSITHHGAPETSSGSAVTNISFKDVLVHFAKMSQTEQRQEAPPPVVTTAITSSPNKVPPPPYPEVTLHPVLTPHSPPSSSLLHGILTKSNHAAAQHRNDTLSGRPATFSPTLARLLTAPERIINTTSSTATSFHGSGAHVSITDLLSTSKTRNEITITPVSSQPHKAKDEVVLVEEEQEDSADRLVIDESGDVDSARGRGEMDDDPGHEMAPEDVPECQGCHQRAAQFVCAGCGNQWYCSRDCQVSAWDEHSEVCSG